MSNLFNPIQAATDYKSGLISKRGVSIRQWVFVAYLLVFAFSLFIPSPYPVHDIVAIVAFLPIYLGIPYYLNRKIDGKDFVARFAVIHTAILIDVMIVIAIAGVIHGTLIGADSVPFSVESGYGVVPITLDILADIFSITFIILAFKKYK